MSAVRFPSRQRIGDDRWERLKRVDTTGYVHRALHVQDWSEMGSVAQRGLRDIAGSRRGIYPPDRFQNRKFRPCKAIIPLISGCLSFLGRIYKGQKPFVNELVPYYRLVNEKRLCGSFDAFWRGIVDVELMSQVIERA